MKLILATLLFASTFAYVADLNRDGVLEYYPGAPTYPAYGAPVVEPYYPGYAAPAFIEPAYAAPIVVNATTLNATAIPTTYGYPYNYGAPVVAEPFVRSAPVGYGAPVIAEPIVRGGYPGVVAEPVVRGATYGAPVTTAWRGF